ncbi:amino acid adenylation domain-containing protein [Amycolatopsis sp. lyj-84]|uniref:amino acid adenylation domain-containing protein n=1 Tax=Amycolatopsis sp. lyj-84 TaxID=2789284 RepID=UPI00397CB352
MTDLSLSALFERQARLAPDACAIEHGGHVLTYAELLRQSTALAAELRAAGVGPEHVVVLDLPVGTRLVAAMLAAGRLGAAFLPLDQRDPRGRRDRLLTDARPAAVVKRDGLVVPEAPPQPLLDRVPRVASPPAYLNYTSGSTGEPKGVVNEQHAIVNYIEAAIAEYRFTPADRQLQFSSIAFDIAIEEVFTALGSGATLVLRDEDFRYEDVEDFLRLVDKWGLTVVNLPTGVWNQLGRALRQVPRMRLPTAVRLMVIGGEAAGPDAAAAWHAAAVHPEFRIVNTYGPTEAAVAVSFAELTADGPVTIGRPIRGVGLAAVDADLRTVPDGELGELLICGIAPARGYLDLPDETSARFGTTADGRWFRTGDLGRVRADGLIEFHGRADEQVKVRGGFRVEPGEVANALLTYPGLVEAAVLPVDLGVGRTLAAFVVAVDTTAPPRAAELRDHLAARLPDYMIPASFTPVSAIPLTDRGKVDAGVLRALQSAVRSRPESSGSVADTVRESWAAALGAEPEDDDADFFDDGGDSVAAVEFLGQLRARLSQAPPLRELYRAPRFGDIVRQLTQDPADVSVHRLAASCPQPTNKRVAP